MLFRDIIPYFNTCISDSMYYIVSSTALLLSKEQFREYLKIVDIETSEHE